MSFSKAASIYARSLFELTSDDSKTSSDELSSLEQLKICFSDPAISQFFENPGSSSDSKKAAISATFSNRISNSMLNFLTLLVDKNRTSLLPEITNQYKKLANEKLGLLQGQVVSATPMNDEFKKQLVQAFENISKKKVTLSYSVNPLLVGGVSAQLGGLSYTDSTDNHLNRLKEDLNRGAK